jgi:AraC-like DNA-binding protein
MKNQVIIWDEMFLSYGMMPAEIKAHEHPVIQLILGATGSYLTKTEKGTWLEVPGLLVAPNIGHECDAKDQLIFSLIIEPLSSLGEHIILTLLNTEKKLVLTPEQINYFDFEKITELILHKEFETLKKEIYLFFKYKHTPVFNVSGIDNRILDVIKYIQTNIQYPINTEVLEEISCLSESRLLHLFKIEMGLPIRKYILWTRLKTVIKIVAEGGNLTEASHEAGFADSAHMTRTFIKNIGIAPSLSLKNSNFVQVNFSEVC